MQERQASKHKNFIEAAVCAKIIDNFVQSGIDASRITVITPFTEQQYLLKSHLSDYGVKVLTIDKA